MDAGLIHIYYGDGKGKTTAAAGIAVRAAGRGKRVVFAQFLKGRETGEIPSLKKLGIEIVRSEEIKSFCWEMTLEQKKKCYGIQNALLEMIKKAVRPEKEIDLLIMDELLNAISAEMLDEKKLKDFIHKKPDNLEIIMTGRTAPEWLTEKADYITEMKNHKHPYDKGISQREGIEF